MALRVRAKTHQVVCAAEEPPMPGDFYVPDGIHGALMDHILKVGPYSEPGLCWECKINPSRKCERCESFGLKCQCACCEERTNRSSHGRSEVGACSCEDYMPNEKCDCVFCRSGKGRAAGRLDGFRRWWQRMQAPDHSELARWIDDWMRREP